MLMLIKKVFSSPEGKELLEMLVDTFVLRATSSMETNQSFYLNGKADLVKWLHLVSKSDPKQIEKLSNGGNNDGRS